MILFPFSVNFLGRTTRLLSSSRVQVGLGRFCKHVDSIVKPENYFVVLFFVFRAFLFQLVAQTHELSPIVVPVIVLCHIELWEGC